MQWFRIWSNDQPTCWERHDAICRVLRGQSIQTASISSLAVGDTVLARESDWRIGEPEHVLPITRIESVCSEFVPGDSESDGINQSYREAEAT